MDFDPKQILKILHQTGVIQKTAPRLPRHQQIEIALRIRLPACDGSKNVDRMSATPAMQDGGFRCGVRLGAS